MHVSHIPPNVGPALSEQIIYSVRVGEPEIVCRYWTPFSSQAPTLKDDSVDDVKIVAPYGVQFMGVGAGVVGAAVGACVVGAGVVGTAVGAIVIGAGLVGKNGVCDGVGVYVIKGVCDGVG
jgi:hypothetical protein